MTWRAAIRAVILALAVLACEAAPIPQPVPTLGPAGEPILDCRAPVQACQTVLQDARTNVGAGVVPVRIQVVCQPGCTPLSGAVDATILYADGTTSQYSMGWEGALPEPRPDPVGEPVPDPAVVLPIPPTCVGVPDDLCLRLAKVAWDGSAQSPGALSITVSCGGSCDAASGAGQVEIRWPGDSSETSPFAY